MKILFIADEESKIYWDFFKKEQFEGIDLIISCGDLKPEYLQRTEQGHDRSGTLRQRQS